MRYYDNGSGFTVSYNPDDAERFSSRWPCSTVRGRGSFAFESNGDLVDVSGTAAKNDGSDWAAFSEDCKKFGESRREENRRKLDPVIDPKSGAFGDI